MVFNMNKDKWIHPQESIVNGKVTYTVKFVGMTEVNDSRGMDVVREALQKLKFTRHIKRSEGTKPPKVDLIININGLRIADHKTKVPIHEIPLHRVSFCADDKQDKRLFSFIAKGSDGKHYCYGLDSQHEANNITLTVGQAFELAYDKFLQSDKATTSKQVIELSKRIELLEKENSVLKERIVELESRQRSAPPTTPTNPTTPTSTDMKNPGSNEHSGSPSTLNQSTYQAIPDRLITDPVTASSRKGTDFLDLAIFNTPFISHSPSNQKYLQSKMTSQSLLDFHLRQANVDQTIASVERAKASLRNLKEYVTQRKLQKEQKANPLTNGKELLLVQDLSSNASFMLKPKANNFDQKSVTKGPKSSEYVRKIPQSTTPLIRIKSSESLYTLNDESMNTIQPVIKENCSKMSCKSDPNHGEVLDQSLVNLVQSNASSGQQNSMNLDSLPETIIGDVLNTRDEIYENYINMKTLDGNVRRHSLPGNFPPPIPPKPKNMQQISTVDSSRFESSCSVSSSDASSLGTYSGHSFRPWTPPETGMCSSQEDNKVPDVRSSSAKDHLSVTLEKFSGEEGYMELKTLKDASLAFDGPNIDSMYGSVHKLMEAVRDKSARSTAKLKKKIFSKQHHQQDCACEHNSGDKAMSARPTEPLTSQPNQPTGQLPVINYKTGHIEFIPVIPRGSSLHDSSSNFLFCTASPSMQIPTHCPPLENKNAPSTSKQRHSSTTDVFDMQPFSLSSTALVKLPSPDDVFPPKVPSRQRSSKRRTAGDSRKNPFAPTNDSTQTNNNYNIFQPFYGVKTTNSQLSMQSSNASTLINPIGPVTSSAMMSSNTSHNVLPAFTPAFEPVSKSQQIAQSRDTSSSRSKDPEFKRKLKVLEEGFSKGLTSREAELSLDAFDPFK